MRFEPKWVPCSERWPEKSGLYLVTREIPNKRNLSVSYVKYDAVTGTFTRTGSERTLAWAEVGSPDPFYLMCEPYKGE